MGSAKAKLLKLWGANKRVDIAMSFQRDAKIRFGGWASAFKGVLWKVTSPSIVKSY